jgi:small-conductance mechanosensitive channel
MSVIAKILIVLNLVLAVVFLGASATFLGQQESWKKKHDDLKTATAAEIADISAQRDGARNTARDQENLANQRQSQVTELQGRLETKENDYTQITESHNTLLGQYERLSQTYKDAVALNDSLTQKNNALVNEKDAALTAKREAIAAQNAAETEQKRLEGELENAEMAKSELAKRMTTLADEHESQTVLLEAYVEKFGSLADVMNPPTIKARVTAVDNDLNIVMLSVGRDDKVKVGYAFTVYRGNEYIGKIIIDKVEADYASGYSQKELEQGAIQVGDDATTRF